MGTTKMIKNFISGFLQMVLVPINTYLIIKDNYIGVFVCAFIMCSVWIYNVKNAVMNSLIEKIIYCFGASFGAIMGLVLYNNLFK